MRLHQLSQLPKFGSQVRFPMPNLSGLSSAARSLVIE
jgi:hypothetical protein